MGTLSPCAAVNSTTRTLSFSFSILQLLGATEHKSAANVQVDAMKASARIVKAFFILVSIMTRAPDRSSGLVVVCYPERRRRNCPAQTQSRRSPVTASAPFCSEHFSLRRRVLPPAGVTALL